MPENYADARTSPPVKRPQTPLTKTMAKTPTKTQAKTMVKTQAKTLAEEWFHLNYSPNSREQNILRTQFINRFGFAVLDYGAVETIRPYGPILEVGAGLGYWTHELGRAGIDAVATDPDTRGRWPGMPHWTNVEILNALEAIEKYPRRNLLTSWPDRDDPWAAQVLTEFQGETVIYVGEGEFGCTGTPEMFKVLRSRFQPEKYYDIPTFRSLCDRLEIWRRKVDVQGNPSPKSNQRN